MTQPSSMVLAEEKMEHVERASCYWLWKMLWKSWYESRDCLYKKLVGMLPVTCSSAWLMLREETLLSQKSRLQTQNYSELICSFNWLLNGAGLHRRDAGFTLRACKPHELEKAQPQFVHNSELPKSPSTVSWQVLSPLPGDKMHVLLPEYPEQWQAGAELLATFGFFKAATRSTQSALSH